MSYRTKNILVKTIGAILAFAVLAGVGVGISSIVRRANEDTRTISPKWEVGGLNVNGKHVDTEETLYTKEAFECRGLEVNLDFDNNIEYQIYFYENDGDFVESTSILSDNYKADDLAFNISHARIVITPIWGEEVEEEDRVFKWSNKDDFYNQLTIKIDKEQEIDFDNMQRYLEVSEDMIMGENYPVAKEGYSYISLNSFHYVNSVDIKFSNDWLSDENCYVYLKYSSSEAVIKTGAELDGNTLHLGKEYFSEGSQVYINFINDSMPKISFNM